MWSGAESLLDRRKPRSISEEGVGGGLGGGVGGGLGGGVGGGLRLSFAGVPVEVDWTPGVGFLFFWATLRSVGLQLQYNYTKL